MLFLASPCFLPLCMLGVRQQRRFTAERDQMQQQYQSDLQRAADTEKQKQEQVSDTKK
jgi:hypothetical protein